MKHIFGVGLFLGMAAALSACGDPRIANCEETDGVNLICNLTNPEDMAALPDGQHVIFSEFGGMLGEASGHITIANVETSAVTRLFPIEGEVPAQTAGWGDDNCPGVPPAGFAPHGIDLAYRADGTLALLVVNHGGREAVEFFEVTQGDTPSVTWRGCAVADTGKNFNDVVWHPDGTAFYVTNMMDLSEGGSQMMGNIKAMLGIDTGEVMRWDAAGGYAAVPGTQGPMPNGVEIAPDGTALYINTYGAAEIRKVSLADGALLGSYPVPGPDNVTWSQDGRLLVAGHPDSLGVVACLNVNGGHCPAAFEIVSVAADMSEGYVLYANEGAPFGAATVALDLTDELWLGTFSGDRIARVSQELLSPKP